MKLVAPLYAEHNPINGLMLEVLASAPSSPAEGWAYYDSTLHALRVRNASTWVSLTGGGGTLTSFTVQAPLVDTGTATDPDINMPAATSSAAGYMTTTFAAMLTDATDSNTNSKLVKRDGSGNFAASTITASYVSLGNAPTDGSHATNKTYVDNLVAGVAAHAAVVGASTGNLTLANEQTVDGVALVAGDRVLVKNQTSALENGIYLVVDSGSWTRAVDADTWADLVSLYVFVEQGTVNADSGFVCTVDPGGTLNTTSVTFVQFSQAGVITAANSNAAGYGVYDSKSGTVISFFGINVGSNKLTIAMGGTGSKEIRLDVAEANLTLSNLGGSVTAAQNGALRYATAVGDGSSTSITVTHNLGTRDCTVAVYLASSPYTVVLADVAMTTTNTVTVAFSTAPTTNQYRVVVTG